MTAFEKPSFSVNPSGAKPITAGCGTEFAHIPSGPEKRRVCLRCGARIASMIVRGERCEIIRNYDG